MENTQLIKQMEQFLHEHDLAYDFDNGQTYSVYDVLATALVNNGYRNVEITRKEVAQEALDLIMHLTCNLALEFGESEYKAIAAHFGLSGEVKRIEPQRDYLKQFAEYLKDYTRECKEVGYDGIGELDIDEKLEEFLK